MISQEEYNEAIQKALYIKNNSGVFADSNYFLVNCIKWAKGKTLTLNQLNAIRKAYLDLKENGPVREKHFVKLGGHMRRTSKAKVSLYKI